MPKITLNEQEIKLTFIRAPGPGGQNVNKVATAVHLRFNVSHSLSIPENIKPQVLSKLSNKLTRDGDIMIKATRYRTQERNKQDALERLEEMINAAAKILRKRKKTKPTKTSTERRLKSKKLQGKNKSLRSRKLNQDF